jgi:hypothetical protein
MPGVVADTHTIVWYLSRDPRLSLAAHEALTMATTAGDLIHIPSIFLVELTYLAEKGRLPSAARDVLIKALDDSADPCTLVPLDRLVPGAWRTWGSRFNIMPMKKADNPVVCEYPCAIQMPFSGLPFSSPVPPPVF